MFKQDTKRRPKNPLSFLLQRKHDPKPRGLFGLPLHLAIQHTAPDSMPIPHLVQQCFAEIVRRGLSIQGILRLSGAASEVQHLMREFDQPPLFGSQLDLASYDIHAVTGVVKKYLCHLPDPVIPNDFHAAFLHTIDLHDDAHPEMTVQHIARLVRQLPPCHAHLLYYILHLSSAIQTHEQCNKMNPEALAVVLAPVTTGLEHRVHELARKRRPILPHKPDIAGLVETNAKWTLLWKVMIEHRDTLLAPVVRPDAVDADTSCGAVAWDAAFLADSREPLGFGLPGSPLLHSRQACSTATLKLPTLHRQASWLTVVPDNTDKVALHRRVLRRLASASMLRRRSLHSLHPSIV